MSDKKDTSTHNYDHKRRTMIAYLHTKMDESDWHAVSDAANDLRVLEASRNNAPKFVLEDGIELVRLENGVIHVCLKKGREFR